MSVRFILHRPRSSQNIGAAARALANTTAGELWVVEPLGFDRAQAAKLAAGADAVLESMRVERTLDDALADCVDVVMTTSRPLEGQLSLEPREAAQRLLSAPGPAALVFGDEVRGLNNKQLARAAAVATIPTTEKKSLNLAQAVLVFAYELMLAARETPLRSTPAAPLADERVLELVRARGRKLLLAAGFLNPQEPDGVLEELVRLLRRVSPSRRESELLLAAIDQLTRSMAKR
jgi:TrmH family RNA methyltransferase